MFKLLDGLFDSNEKQLKRYQVIVDGVNALEPKMKKLSDEKLAAKTEEFRKKNNVELEHARDERDPFLPPLSKEQVEEQKNKYRENLY